MDSCVNTIGWTLSQKRALHWRKPSWAERQGVPVVVLDSWVNGVFVTERSRVTNWGWRKADVQKFLQIRDRDFRAKGRRAVVVGVIGGNGTRKYAVFA